MSDAATKPTAKKATKPKTAPTHPPVASMVTAAIKTLKDRKGSSLAAIKKYISANYKCDVAKLAPFIRKFLKNAVADGKLTQVKGTGAAGSFKMNAAAKEEKPKKAAAKKPAVKKDKKTTPKKAKKPAAKKTKPAGEKKAKKPATKKSPKKADKPKKAKTPKKAAKPAKKAKTPKKTTKKPAAAKKAAKK